MLQQLSGSGLLGEAWPNRKALEEDKIVTSVLLLITDRAGDRLFQ